MNSFLYYCAGSDRQLLKRCSRGERLRHSAVGTFVVLTGILAFVSGGYALSTIFEDSLHIAIGVAALWGFVIFSLDRFIVMAMAETSIWRRLVHALPRLVLAMFIALVVARPLELRIFEEEIEAKIRSQKDAEIDSVGAQFDAQQAEADRRLHEKIEKLEGSQAVRDVNDRLAKLNADVSDCRNREQEALQSYHAEMDGSGGTRRRGIGPIAQRKEKTYQELVRQCSALAAQRQLEIDRRVNQQKAHKKTEGEWRAAAQEEAARMKSRRDERLAQLEDYPDSFLQRHSALVLLQRSDEGVNSAVILITLLFVLIECSPIFSKLLTSPGHYEKLLLSRKEDEKIALQRLESDREVEKERTSLEQEIKIELVKGSRAEIAKKGRGILESWKKQVVPADLVQELEKSARDVWSSAYVSSFASSRARTEGFSVEADEMQPAGAPESLSPEMRWLTLFMGVCLIAAASLFVWKWTHGLDVAMAAGLMAAGIVKGVSDYLNVATNRLVLAIGVCMIAAAGFFMWRWTHQYHTTFSAALLTSMGASWASNHWYKWREEKGEA